MRFVPIESMKLGPMIIYIWGLFVALGIIAGIALAARRAKKRGVGLDQILNLSIIIILSGFLGARIVYFIINWDFYHDDLVEFFKVWHGGFAAYGGFLALPAVYFYAKIAKIYFRKIADIFAPAIFLSLFFGRIGCFLVNDHLGKMTNLPWAIDFGATPRHPIAAYYGLAAFLGCITLLVFDKKVKDKPAGVLAALALVFYGAGRFLIDFFARDYSDKNLAIYNEIFLLIIFALGISLMFFIYAKRSKKV